MQGDLKAAQQEIVTKVIATWRQKWTNVFSPNSLNAWNRWVKSRVASAHPQANSRWMRSRSNKYAPKPNCPNQKFADVIDAQVSTLRNWEHGRRAPTGPAKALLRAIDRDQRTFCLRWRSAATSGCNADRLTLPPTTFKVQDSPLFFCGYFYSSNPSLKIGNVAPDTSKAQFSSLWVTSVDNKDSTVEEPVSWRNPGFNVCDDGLTPYAGKTA